MAGRPRLGINTTGAIRCHELANGKWQAIANHRDVDGRTRQYSRTAGTRAAAVAAMKSAMAGKVKLAEGRGAIHSATRLTALAEEYFKRQADLVEKGRRSPGTVRLYQGHWRNHIEPALGGLSVTEADVQCIDRFLIDLRDQHSADLVKTVRAVLSGMMGIATRYKAIPANPVRDATPIPGEGRHRVKALEAGEAVHIWRRLSDLAHTPAPLANNRRYRPTLCDQFVPDLWLWMLGTGDRISNALAVRWRFIDMDTGNARLGANVIRVPGVGLRINEGTSKSHEVEGVDLPEQVIAMLLARQQRDDYNPMGLVFPGRFGELRDPSNVSSKQLRPALKAIGYGHVSSHWCRRTLGSELNAAGMTLMEIAGRLRHSDSRTTERHYVAKRGGNPRVKAAIEAMLATEPERRVVTLDR